MMEQNRYRILTTGKDDINKMKVLENLQPASVFKYFEEITQIPHGSKNVEKISNYLVDFAKEHNLKYIQDESKNVIIFKGIFYGIYCRDGR